MERFFSTRAMMDVLKSIPAVTGRFVTLVILRAPSGHICFRVSSRLNTRQHTTVTTIVTISMISTMCSLASYMNASINLTPNNYELCGALTIQFWLSTTFLVVLRTFMLEACRFIYDFVVVIVYIIRAIYYMYSVQWFLRFKTCDLACNTLFPTNKFFLHLLFKLLLLHCFTSGLELTSPTCPVHYGIPLSELVNAVTFFTLLIFITFFVF